jgi:very-short-patch-repair endonuclease
MQCPEVRQKSVLTNIERYGYPNAIQNPEVQQKIRQALMENGTGKASAQQKQVHTMVQEKYPEAQLNYPVAPFSLDVFVCVDDVKIDIEYDGSHWHQDQQRDIKRDKTLQSQGFKIIRIRSGRLVPNKQELFDAIDCLANTERRFVEIILSDWKKEEGEECQRQLQALL